MSQIIHYGKTDYSNKTQGSYTASARSLPDKDFKGDWGFKMFCSSSYEEAQRNGQRATGQRYNNDCLRATVKHGGGSLQVWGCISANGVGDLVRINGVLNTEKYRQILIHHANTIREAYDWPQMYSAAGQLPQTYSQCHKELSSP